MLRVGVGLAVLGVTSYVYLSVAARQLSTSGFASVSVLWSVIYIIGPGVFQPFEQQLGRDLAARLARGQTGLDRPARVIGVAAVAVLALCAVTLAFEKPIAGLLFGGSSSLVLALLLSYVALAAAYVYRGILAGAGRFDLYGAQLAVEGLARLIGCAAIWWLGSVGAGAFAVLIPIAQAIAVLVTARPKSKLLGGHKPTVDGVKVSDPAHSEQQSQVGIGLAQLVAAAVLSQALVNSATLLARLLDRRDPGLVGELQAGLLIARVPLLLFAAIPAALLPRLSAMVATGQFSAMRRRTGVAVAGVGAAMAVATILGGTVGPRIVRLVFGSSYIVSGRLLAALTGATGLFMMGGVVATAVLARGWFGRVAIGWGVGVAALGVALLLGLDPASRIAIGFLAGTAVSLIAFLALSLAATSAPGSGALLRRKDGPRHVTRPMEVES